MSNFVWSQETTPSELIPMLEALEFEYPVSSRGRGLKLQFKRIKDKDTVSRVTRKSGSVTIEYTSIAAAARGLGNAFADVDGTERTPFSSLGIMLDVSRNQVMKVDHVKGWMRRLALAGNNLILIYAENTYELEDDPFFGYMRGGYTLEELQELDQYAADLGIELVGCIQVLAHMQSTLRWADVYQDIKDTATVMLVDEPKTYALIQKMLDFWGKALRSRRIHIGMDEAWDLARGVFLNRHGYEREFDVFNRHLAKVNGMCKKAGLAPMIWSDMYFRLSNPAHDYYDPNHKVPKDVASAIPKNVRLVYWDYYHNEQSFYETMIDRHAEMGFPPVMASGIWTWSKMWYDHVRTAATIRPCIAACRSRKVRELCFTMWGDDGAYCHYDSALAGIVFASDLAYGSDDEELTAARFEAICHADYASQIIAGEMCYIDSPAADPVTKMLLVKTPDMIWDDPLLGMAFDSYKRKDPEFDLKLVDKCDEILCHLLPRIDENAAGDVAHAVNTLRAIMTKTELRGSLEAAYDAGDRVALREIAVTMVPAAIAAMKEFDSSFREQWLNTAKPFGLEVIQVRNAGVIARLEELGRRLREFLNGDTDVIDELEARLPLSAPSMRLHTHTKIHTAGQIW